MFNTLKKQYNKLSIIISKSFSQYNKSILLNGISANYIQNTY